MKTIDEKYTVTSSAPSRLQAVPISKLLEIGITEDELIGLRWICPRAPSDVTQTLVEQILRRAELGLSKYGTTLDRTDLALADWLQHQSEELMDAAGYALAAKRELTKLLEIKRAATALVESVSQPEVTPATRRRLTSDLKLVLQQ